MIYHDHDISDISDGTARKNKAAKLGASMCKHVQALHTTALKHHEIHSGPQSWHSYFFTGIVRQATAGLSANLSDPVSDDHHESCMVSTT